MKFRDYQQTAYNEIHEAWNSRAANVCAVMPTGAGKTVLSSGIVRDNRSATAVIAHRQELVGQLSVALARNEVKHRIIAPEKTVKLLVGLQIMDTGKSFYDSRSGVAVAGVDTLVRRVEALEHWRHTVGLWLIDECHHVLLKNKWGKAVNMFPNARGLGVTATPLRADGHGLGRHADGVFDTMVVGPTMRELINRGFLTDYRIFAPTSDIDLSKVDLSQTTGDYNANGVRKAVHESHVVGDVVTEYGNHAHGKLGVTFAVDVQSATDISNAFNAAGIRSEVVSAKTPDLMRADILNRFKRREILQLINVDLFGEGFDLPAIEVVSMARPTASYSLFAQQFGRALRIMEGKDTALIIDHVGNCLRHGLPDRPMDWSLDARERRTGVNTPDDVIPVKCCPECTAVYERIHKACPYCGFYAAPEARNGPEKVDGDLTELDEATLAALRGEAAQVDMSEEEFKIDMHRRRVPDIGRPRALRAFREKKEAQTELRQLINVWNNYHAGLGREQSEIQKRFYWAFGSDQLSACTLGTKEARALSHRMTTEVKRWK